MSEPSATRDPKLWRAAQNWRFRIGQLEIGSCDEYLGFANTQDRAEISQWSTDNEHRWVVASFKPGPNTGWDLVWVNDRPLEGDWDDFGDIVALGFHLLRGEFRHEQSG